MPHPILESPAHPTALDRAYRHCLELARSHYENFPVASRLLPRRLRPPIAAIYAFARAADDFADEGYAGERLPAGVAPTEDQRRRLEAIDAWRERLRAMYRAAEPDHPIFVALSDTVLRFDLPEQLLADLLSAFRQDVVQTRYDTFDDLLDYCRRSADPIGRLVLLVFGYGDEHLHRLSDRICTALQLANHWQDIWIDLQKDRIYLPVQDRESFGVSEDALRERRVDASFRDLLAFEIARTRALFEQGRMLPSLVGSDLRLQLRLTWLGGMTILRKIERAGYDVFRRRPVLGFQDKLALLVRSLIGFRRRA